MIERVSISGVSTPGGSWAGDLLDYVAAGAGGVGMTEDKLVPGGEPAALAHFIESGLKATLALPAVPSLLPGADGDGPDDPGERSAAISTSVRRFAVFDPIAVALRLGPIGGDDDQAAAVDGLRQVARVALSLHPRGVQLALCCGGATASIDAALEIAAEAGEPGIRLALDGWGVASVDDAVRNVESIACVQLLGAAAGGALEELVAALDDAGYRGYYELALPPDGDDPDPPRRLGAAVLDFRAVYDAATARVGLGSG